LASKNYLLWGFAVFWQGHRDAILQVDAVKVNRNENRCWLVNFDNGEIQLKNSIKFEGQKS
jgi:hypothetical protein